VGEGAERSEAGEGSRLCQCNPSPVFSLPLETTLSHKGRGSQGAALVKLFPQAFRPKVILRRNLSIAGTSNGRTVIACKETFHAHKPDTDLVTSRMLGCFRDNALTRQEFLGMAT